MDRNSRAYLKDRGHYTASGDAERDIAPLKARIAASPEFYGKTTITEFTGVDQEIAPPGSADFVLTSTIGCTQALRIPPSGRSIRP